MTPPALAVQTAQLVVSAAMFLFSAAAVYVSWSPLRQLIRLREQECAIVLHDKLLTEISPRAVTIVTLLAMILLALLALSATGSFLLAAMAMAVVASFPPIMLYILRRRRLLKLEEQLITGIQTLASGVRAGLNLIQSMQLVARDGPIPLRQEFIHLLKEYEYGIPLDEAMDNAAARIGSGDFRLLFAALQTHRQRGGDLGETLDRISASIREIQRLENRVKTLTAEGRATARWLGVMPIAVGAICYLVNPQGIMAMFHQTVGNVILVAIVTLNILGFLWIRKIVAIDI